MFKKTLENNNPFKNTQFVKNGNQTKKEKESKKDLHRTEEESNTKVSDNIDNENVKEDNKLTRYGKDHFFKDNSKRDKISYNKMTNINEFSDNNSVTNNLNRSNNKHVNFNNDSYHKRDIYHKNPRSRQYRDNNPKQYINRRSNNNFDQDNIKDVFDTNKEIPRLDEKRINSQSIDNSDSDIQYDDSCKTTEKNSKILNNTTVSNKFLNDTINNVSLNDDLLSNKSINNDTINRLSVQDKINIRLKHNSNSNTNLSVLLNNLKLADQKYGTSINHQIKLQSADVNTYSTLKWEELKINELLCEVLRKLEYTYPSPVQRECIVKNGGDMVVRAKNGTGKTLGYLIPLLNDHLNQIGENKQSKNIQNNDYTPYNPINDTLNDISSNNKKNKVKILILVPTRELALQVAKVFKRISSLLDDQFILLPSYGGTNLYEDILRIRTGVEGVISTPGRILDLIERRIICTQSIETLILDEADKLLSIEYKKCLDRIIRIITKRNRNHKNDDFDNNSTNCNRLIIKLFSATFPLPVNSFVRRYMDSPTFINLMRENYLLNHLQFYCNVEESDKLNCLIHLMKKLIFNQLIIFVNTADKAEKLASCLLEMGYSCYYIHGRMIQEERNRVYHGFVSQMERIYNENKNEEKINNLNKSPYIQILISTDLSTRGIDVPHLNLVINFDFPYSTESYIHRIGRAGRFGSRGVSISFVKNKEENEQRRVIEGKIGKEMQSVGEESFKEFCK